MMTLYVKDGCPYCAKVIEEADELGVQLTLKNMADEGVEEELIARGGKKLVPYLVDSESGKEMYEANAIISYLSGGEKPNEEIVGVCKLE